MAISRLQASLAAATNEVTIAAANINFDFTLMKCEAPKEYHDLGDVLSHKRRTEAEVGTAHITAKKLGALFDGVCPPTPNLLKAYGTRVSEIARDSRSSSTEPLHSIFAAHSGVDGTSIWAAATSSTSALHVQLLACMLARVWNAPEAISVWVELVKERRKQIVVRFEGEEEVRYSTVAAAAQPEIPRSALAEWDASTRAWLRTADNIKTREQNQLMLILANVNIPVNDDFTVFTSVMTAWEAALGSMERLVSGMPQAVNNGPTLLALSSWHLYPDIVVIGQGVEVKFRDHLIPPGGALTIGLKHEQVGEPRGVYWSLSLAHLTFYGPPTTTRRRLDHESAKLSFDQFTLAVLGCIAGSWRLPHRSIDQCARFFTSLHAAIERASVRQNEASGSTKRYKKILSNSSHWVQILARASWTYLDRSENDRGRIDKYVRLGIRRASKFIPDIASNLWFGLAEPKVLLSLLRDEDARIGFLRRVASKKGPNTSDTLIIRSVGPGRKYRYATATPVPAQVRENKSVSDNMEYTHLRWLPDNDGKPCAGEVVHILDDMQSIVCPQDGENQDDSFLFNFPSGQEGPQWNRYVKAFGVTETSALFEVHGLFSLNDYYFCSLEDAVWCLDQDMFSTDKLLEYIEAKGNLLTKALDAFSFASMVYKLIPGATISLAALEKPIHETAWAKHKTKVSGGNRGNGQNQLQLSKAMEQCQALSLIAYMESGYDIDPNLLEGVFALAHEDSLYISMSLTCDPWETPAPYEFKRVLGNVGKPGITMLVPPKRPMVRPMNPESWRAIRNNIFDGNPEDHFKNTSLHLSFTDYYIPLYQQSIHHQDNQVWFWESIVSVHDSGAWVGDLDILQSLRYCQIDRIKSTSCSHADQKVPECDLISVEGWEDILDLPQRPVVIRAHGNWIARLATAALISSLLKVRGNWSVRICPSNLCWNCRRELLFNEQEVVGDDEENYAYIF